MAFKPVNHTEAPVDNQQHLDNSYNDQGYIGYDGDYSNDYDEPKEIVDIVNKVNSEKNIPKQEVKTQDKPTFNIPKLDSTPLADIIKSLGGEKVKANGYKILENEIIIKDNKWYNTTQKRGHTNGISLMKHLLGIKNNLPEFENQKRLFVMACNELMTIKPELVQEITSQIVTTPEVKTEEIVNNVENVTQTANTQEVKTEVKENAKFKKNIDWNTLTEKLNQIPLNLVMEHIGANANEDGQRGKWKVWKTGHNIQITGQQWHSWNAQRGGVGGISLLAFQMGIENNIDDRDPENKKQLRKMAIKDLLKVFGDEFEIENTEIGGTDNFNLKEPFAMPIVIEGKINQVRQYLHEKRGLPMWIINKQIKAGSLFAGYPSDWKEEPLLNTPEKLTNDKVWATFLAVNGNAAEMRAIERSDNFAKLLAKGSDKELGGFLIKAEKDCNEKTVVACEAAIDTMSYHFFYPGRIVTSCMGVNFNLAVKTAVESLDNGYKFQLAFDNDLAGNEAAVRFKEELIKEIGDEEYDTFVSENKINYFDLGVRCFRKTIEKGGIFYFDVKNNDTGREAAKMFQDQIHKTMSKDDLREIVKAGKLKYANIAPIWGLITDAKKEAKEAFDLLNSNKPYYLVLKHEEDDTDVIKAKKELFEKEFKEICGDNLATLEKEGKVLYKKQALVKDWNEFYNVMKKDPRFNARLADQENKYNNYSQDFGSGKRQNKTP